MGREIETGGRLERRRRWRIDIGGPGDAGRGRPQWRRAGAAAAIAVSVGGLPTPLTAPPVAEGSEGLPGVFRVELALPGGVADESGTLRVDLVSVGPGGLEIDGAGDRSQIAGLPPTSLSGEEGLLLRRQARNPWEPGYRRFVSEPIAAVADLRASFHYAATPRELERCARCDLVAEGVYPSPEVEPHREILAGHALAVRFPPELRRQLELVYSPETLARAELTIEAVPWDLSPAIRQEPAQNPSTGTGDVAPDTLLHSGEPSLTAIDLTIRGRGFDFAFIRTYRNQTIGAGPLGPGWDHNYRQRLRALPDGDVEYYDGRGRRETFRREGEALVSPPGRFATLQRVSGGWVMLDAHRNLTRFDRWGRLVSIADAVKQSEGTGNAMRFQYDSRSRLVRVVDTLGRYVHLHYDDAGRLVRMRDFSGREVAYLYDALGRLVEVASPAVATVDSPTPEPLVTRYAYREVPGGDLTAALRLRDDLVEVTDPKGQAWLQLVYTDADGDGIDQEVTAQTWGTGELSIAYDLAARQAAVTDRRGNATLYQHNAMGQVTRIEDPVGAVWRMSYDDEGLETESVEPLGRVTSTTYEQGGSRRARGNALEVRVTPDSRGANGSAGELVTAIEYHGKTNLPVRVTDPRANMTVIERRSDGLPTSITEGFGSPSASTTRIDYNAFGQPVRVTNPNGNVTELAYFDSGPSEGYLRELLVDPGGLELKATFTTDARGNVTSVTGPRSVRNETIYNALDWAVEKRRGVTGSSDGAPPLGYTYRYLYDQNGNLAQEQIPFGASSMTVNRFTYGILDEVLEESREIQPGGVGGAVAVTVYERDPNLNVTRVTDPENHETAIEYDARDLPLAVSRGLGAGALAVPIVEGFGHSADRERTRFTDGRGNAWLTAFDGYGRPREIRDPLGNLHRTEYDENGNPTTRRVFDLSGELLAESTTAFDALDRPTSSTEWLWEHDADPAAEPISERPEGSQAVTTVTAYDPASNVETVIDPLGRVTSFEYDAAERLDRLEDPMGNVEELELDKNGNVTERTTTEVSTDGSAAVTVTESATYDAVDRRLSWTDGEGNRWERRYDARDLVVRDTDPAQHSTTYGYDGLDRRVRLTRPSGIEVTYGWDKASRHVGYVDALGNATTYTYDAADRRTSVVYADGTTESYTYDAADNLLERLDANQTRITQGFDLANRLTSRSAVSEDPGYTLAGILSETFTWDGLYRLTSGQSGSGIRTELRYDSLSRLLSDTTAERTVTYGLDAVGNVLALGYPSGGTVARSFDPLDRQLAIEAAGSPVATYGYRGALLQKSKTLEGGLAAQWTFDGARRPKAIDVRRPGDVLVHGEALGFDRRNLKVINERPDLQGLWRLQNDGAGQLTKARWMRSTENEEGDVREKTIREFRYEYDTAQNLTKAWSWELEQELEREWVLDPDPRNRPRHMRPLNAEEGFEVEHDANGNRTRGGERRYLWDFRNRLVAVELFGELVASYDYDIFNRRIRKLLHVTDPEPGEVVEEWTWAGQQEIEELRSGQLFAVYERGPGLDEVVRARYDLDLSGDLEAMYLPVYDSSGNVVELLRGDFETIATYEYDPYGGKARAKVDTEAPEVGQVRVDASGRVIVEASEEVSQEALERAVAEGDLSLVETPPSQAIAVPTKSASSKTLAVSVDQPVLRGRRARQRFVLTTTDPPAAGAEVTLSIQPDALRDLFGNDLEAPYQLTFTWPEPRAAGAVPSEPDLKATGDAVLVADHAPPEIDSIYLLDGHLQLGFSEEIDLDALAAAFEVDGETVEWEKEPESGGYLVRTTVDLGLGTFTIYLPPDVLLDLAGNSPISTVDETITVTVDTISQVIRETPDPRETQGEVVANRFTFHGHPYDPEANLYYFRNRWYDGETGRFVSADPYGFADSPSPYQAFGNSPFNFRDPTGQYLESPLEAVSVGVGSASLAYNLNEGHYGWAALDVAGIAVDLAAMAVPGVPGYAGLGIRGMRGGAGMAQASRVGMAVRRAQLGVQAIDVGQGLYESGMAFGQGQYGWGAFYVGMSGLGAGGMRLNVYGGTEVGTRVSHRYATGWSQGPTAGGYRGQSTMRGHRRGLVGNIELDKYLTSLGMHEWGSPNIVLSRRKIKAAAYVEKMSRRERLYQAAYHESFHRAVEPTSRWIGSTFLGSNNPYLHYRTFRLTEEFAAESYSVLRSSHRLGQSPQQMFRSLRKRLVTWWKHERHQYYY